MSNNSTASLSRKELNLILALQAHPGAHVVRIGDSTPSMLGTGYAGNDVVMLPNVDLEPGQDAIFKWHGNKRALHRVKAVREKNGQKEYYFQGTFNSTGDGWIPHSEVIGRVVYPKPKM